MEDLERKIWDRLYDFYSDKGLLGKVASEKMESWKIMTDLSLEIIIGIAKESLKVPESLKNTEVKNIQVWFDFVCKNFSNEINQLKDYYQLKSK